MGSCLILQFSIIVVININSNYGGNQVEAIPKQDLRTDDWFHGLERINLPYYQESQDKDDQSTDMTKMPYEPKSRAPYRSTGVKGTTNLKKRKIKWRKRHITIDKLEKKKRKRKIKLFKKNNKKKTRNGKFVVTTVKERVYNNSVSVDGRKASKPFDIIVHIKMNE